MTKEQIEILFARLRAYFPGEWDEARCIVWAEAFVECGNFRLASEAVRLMGQTEKFATVAAFREKAGLAQSQVTSLEDGLFLPGTGPCEEWKPRPELPAGEQGDPVVYLAEARARLRGVRKGA